MGLLGSIFRRPRTLPVENLAALPAAVRGLAKKGYAFAGKAGVCLKKEGPTKLDMTGLLAAAGLAARYELATDEYGCTWIVLRGGPENTIASAVTACRRLNEARRGGEILCVAFEFAKDGRKAYWIYNRKGMFYPFVPQDSEHDVLQELRMRDAGTGILPVESSVTRWHPLWGMPF
jgi:hypothetical protein